MHLKVEFKGGFQIIIKLQNVIIVQSFSVEYISRQNIHNYNTVFKIKYGTPFYVSIYITHLEKQNGQG